MANVLILGSGGREHALALKISQSSSLSTLFIAPGNPGTAMVGENVVLDIMNFKEISEFCVQHSIDYLCVGPEAPLVNGISDYFKNHCPKTFVIGPSKMGAALEGSKSFCKSFLEKHGIPTARYRSFAHHQVSEAKAYLRELKPPYVIKADGLAAGKGVVIASGIAEAEKEIEAMLTAQKFGKASETVVIEEFLKGVEVSVFIVTDGKHYKILPEAKDYKRIGDKDTGPNTGGMGAVSPVPFADREFMMKVEERIIQPTVKGIHLDGLDYKGFLFLGLMSVKGDPYVIEYNVRLGDPETEVVMLRMRSDLVELFEGLATGTLSERHVEIEDNAAAAVVMVSDGYPGDYSKGHPIHIGIKDQAVFHAGTTLADGTLVTSGGRVLVCAAMGKTLGISIRNAYEKIRSVSYKGLYYRTDIGKDLMEM